MSWVWELGGGEARKAPKSIDEVPLAPGEEKVADPSIPGRMVRTKSANKPFLAHKEYRDSQEKAHNDWLQRKKERDEKIARGEKVGPLEPDPTAEEEVGLLGLLKFIVYLLLLISLSGKFITGSYTWEYETRLAPTLKSWWPTDQRLFTEGALANYDGSDPKKPLYIAIDGDVYDVSSNRKTYGPGGSYHGMAGVDAARSFATGCFATHRTHDTRGLNEKEMRGLEHWKKFFAEHKSYPKVGKVKHHPIDPASPIPEHCDPKKQAAQEKAEAEKADAAAKKRDGNSKHEEL